ncbi:MAG: hypothetical protein K2M47_06840 [Clostridiales bacterium]|nr:hypothetical protein [Clostridiales bacterium]
MKGRKFLLSTLAAAVFATSAGALVACGDGLDLPDGTKLPENLDNTHTITFDAGTGATLKGIDGNSLTTSKLGFLSGAMPTAEKNENNDDYTFEGWGLEAGQTVPSITAATYNSHLFTEDVTVYAVFKEKTGPVGPGPGTDDDEEYTITFLGGDHGTVSIATVTTTGGKIAENAFPTVTADAGWIHAGWVAEEGGFPVNYTYTFTGNMTVVATYDVDPVTEAPAVLVVGNTEYAMTLNENMDPTAVENGMDKEYIALGIDLTAGSTLTFKVRNDAGELVAVPSFFVDKESQGVDISVTSSAVTGLDVLRTGTYATISLKHNTQDLSGNAAESWSVYASDGQGKISDIGDLTDGGHYLVGWFSDWQMKEANEIKTGQSLEIELTSQVNSGGEMVDNWFKICGCALTTNDEGEQVFEMVWAPTGTNEFNWYQLDAASQALVTKEGGNETGVKVKEDGTYIITIVGPSQWTITKKGTIITPPTPTPTEGPDRVNEGADVKMGEQAFTDTTATIERTDSAGNAINQTLADQFALEGVTITELTEVSFTVDGTVIPVWVETATTVTVKANNKLVNGEGALGARDTVVTLVEGTYNFYLKYYTDGGAAGTGGWNVYVAGTTTGEFEGGGDVEDTRNRVYKDAVINMNGEAMTDTTASVDATDSLNDQFYKEITLTEQTDVTFTVDGTKIASMWIKHAATVQVKANGSLVPVETVGDGGARSSKFTLPAGTYRIYLKNYSDNRATLDWVVWVEGTTTGEFSTTPTEDVDHYYLVGESARLGLEWATIADADDIPDAIHFTTTDGVTFVLEVELDAGVNFKLCVAGTGWDKEVGYSAIQGNANFSKNSTSNIHVDVAGKYKLTYNAQTQKLTAERLGDVTELAMTFDVYIHGNFVTNWSSQSLQTGVAGGSTITVTCDLTQGRIFGIKVTLAGNASSQTGWGAAGVLTNNTNGGLTTNADNNLVCSTAGKYQFEITIDATGNVTKIIATKNSTTDITDPDEGEGDNGDGDDNGGDVTLNGNSVCLQFNDGYIIIDQTGTGYAVDGNGTAYTAIKLNNTAVAVVWGSTVTVDMNMSDVSTMEFGAINSGNFGSWSKNYSISGLGNGNTYYFMYDDGLLAKA